MQYDLNKQIEICKGIIKIQERANPGIVSLITYLKSN